MATGTTPTTVPNPDLVVGEDDKAYWNLPDNRRSGFHNLQKLTRYSLGIRASDVLPLSKAIDERIGDMPEVRRYTGTTYFSAMAVVREQSVLFETYAPDFGPDRPHSMQSVGKTAASLILGRLVEDGRVELDRKVAHYLPEIGTGYADATVQQVLDMDVVNNFDEGYDAPYSADPLRGAPVGYNNEEIALGWRLPPAGEPEFGCRALAAALVSDDVTNPTGETRYASPNTDVLGWIAERAGGRGLRELLVEIVEAAGIAGVYHIGTDCEGVPQIAGGVCMTARDLARYGLLFARLGMGVHGESVGSAKFIQETRSGRGTRLPEPSGWLRYSNHTTTDGRWLGHGGYGGQYLLADPDTRTVVAFFSVLEDRHAYTEDYLPGVVRMAEDIIRLYDA